ncbi:hypothetical protein [Streptomyces nigra]|uniref:hypothetical protein n=1 Tax=Streptomyces nigra TaxID=1827580 RepID=UPI003653DC70
MAAGRERRLIVGDRYTSRSRLLGLWEGAFIYDEPVTGAWLRYCRAGARTRILSVHLELPSGSLTLHSPAGDVFFHPASKAWAPDSSVPYRGVRADALRRVRMIVLGRDCVS